MLRLYKYTVLILLSGVITTGCPSNSSSSSSAPQDDQDLLPEPDTTPPSLVRRRSVFVIPLELPVGLDLKQGIGGIYENNPAFNLSGFDSYYLGPNLAMNFKDGLGVSHQLTMHVLKSKNSSSLDPDDFLSFNAFFLVDDTPISLIKQNDAHTAYYLKGGNCNSSGETKMTFVAKEDNKLVDKPSSQDTWFGACVEYKKEMGVVKVVHYPNTTQDPRYLAESDAGPPPRVRDENSPITLQYLVPMGTMQYNWVSFSFTDESQYPVSGTSEEQSAAAVSITRNELETISDNDIGWTGVPSDHRQALEKNNQYKRQLVEIRFVISEGINTDDTIHISENSITFEEELDGAQASAPQAITHPSVTLEYKEHY